MPGKLWRGAYKSVKTGKAAGVFGCGNPEDAWRMDAEMKTAMIEFKALSDGQPNRWRFPSFPKGNFLIYRGANFSRRQGCKKLG